LVPDAVGSWVWRGRDRALLLRDGERHEGLRGDPGDGRGGAGPVAILNNRFRNTRKLIRIVSGTCDCVIVPQYEDSSMGSIELPQPNEGLFGAPHIVRASGSALTGLVIPSSAQDPTHGTVDGQLAYNTTLNALRVRQGGAWRTVEVQ
jgi:hypothetical protein